jgi:hypothetical protein
MTHAQERDREQERAAAEKMYCAARDALAEAPYESATWLAARALIPSSRSASSARRAR